jgi:hypothetical protein
MKSCTTRSDKSKNFYLIIYLETIKNPKSFHIFLASILDKIKSTTSNFRSSQLYTEMRNFLGPILIETSDFYTYYDEYESGIDIQHIQNLYEVFGLQPNCLYAILKCQCKGEEAERLFNDLAFLLNAHTQTPEQPDLFSAYVRDYTALLRHFIDMELKSTTLPKRHICTVTLGMSTLIMHRIAKVDRLHKHISL